MSTVLLELKIIFFLDDLPCPAKVMVKMIFGREYELSRFMYLRTYEILYEKGLISCKSFIT